MHPLRDLIEHWIPPRSWWEMIFGTAVLLIIAAGLIGLAAFGQAVLG